MPNTIEQHIYFIEHTDLFGTEANYAWVKRYKVTAKDYKQAMRRLSKYLGTHYKTWGHYPESFKDKYSHTVYFVYDYDSEYHDKLLYVTEIN